MWYPEASAEQIASFREHGYLVVDDAIPSDDLDELEGHLDELILQKEKLAFDWAWDENEEREQRSFKIVQSWPELVWPEIARAPFRTWAAEFGSALLGTRVGFWYNQFLGKPPHNDAPTYWHQDEGYWGRNLTNKGITSWIPLQDVDVTNGCMHFIDGSHLEGVLEHEIVDGVKSDLLHCSPDETRAVGLPGAPWRRDVPPLGDGAHDHRERLRSLAQGAHPAHADARRGRRGRPLPLEDLRGPADGQDDHP
jgi:hypothetical protein